MSSRNLVPFALLASLSLGGAALACENAKSCPMKSSRKPVLDPVDQLLAAKCDCGGKGDCTCKKGTCKCKKCSQHKPAKVVPSMRDADVELPREARHDASGGIFI